MNKDCILIKRIEDIGEARYHVWEAMCHDLFDDCGKHNTRWQHKDPQVEDLLDEIRREINSLHDRLISAHDVLAKDYDDL